MTEAATVHEIAVEAVPCTAVQLTIAGRPAVRDSLLRVRARAIMRSAWPTARMQW